MKRELIVGLIGINLALAAGLWWRTASNTAHAQVEPPAKKADYLAVPGRVPSIPAEVIFVLDTANGKLGAIAPDTQGILQSMPGRIDLNDLAAMAADNQTRQENERGPRRRN
jgi:hypothetical protein